MIMNYGFCVVYQPSTRRRVLNVENYNYTTTASDDVTLTQYIGTNPQVIVPVIEEI